jgi:hypothetical protein
MEPMDIRCGQTGRWLAGLCLKMLSIIIDLNEVQ